MVLLLVLPLSVAVGDLAVGLEGALLGSELEELEDLLARARSEEADLERHQLEGAIAHHHHRSIGVADLDHGPAGSCGGSPLDDERSLVNEVVR